MYRTILHCDCNSFYASVETVLDPSLASGPMAVCGDPDSRHGIILAKNEQAKACGVKTAETIWQAKRKCPDLRLVAPHREEYVRYSRRANQLYLEFTDLVEPFGIDESFLDVTGSMHLFGSGQQIADTLRRRMREELGLTISVGVSFNKAFAKLGSDYKKPDATTLLSPETYREIIWPLPVGALLYAGPKAQQKLHILGIDTIGQLAAADPVSLHSALGKLGDTLLAYARGEDHDPVRSFYLEFTDLVEPFGIDESFLDVTGSMHLFGNGQQIADTLRRRMREELGLTISVGVSFNKAFAKLGSDYKKPDATTLLSPETYREIIWPLPVGALLYAGPKAQQKLHILGIDTIGQLAAADPVSLHSVLGKLGDTLSAYARGEDHDPVRSFYAEHTVKSIGKGMTFAHNLTHVEEIRLQVMMLCDHVGTRLRARHLQCQTVQVLIRDPDFHNISRQITLPTATDSTRQLTETALSLIAQHWKPGKPIRMITVTAASLLSPEQTGEQLSLFDAGAQLTETALSLIAQHWKPGKPIRMITVTAASLLSPEQTGEQLSLFDAGAAERREKQQKLDRAVDALRGKYGKDAVQYGASLAKRVKSEE